MPNRTLVIRQPGLLEYRQAVRAMQRYTEHRDDSSADEIWILQHPPVYTLGRSGKKEHVLDPGQIPVIQSDRGGQVTYHGPGQLVVYLLLDLQRLQLGIRQLVEHIEEAVIRMLAGHDVVAGRRQGAPGVYIGQHKIAALGLRVRHGCSYHGLSLNCDMDLTPFRGINPCGYADLEVTQLKDLNIQADLHQVADQLLPFLTERFEYDKIIRTTDSLPD